MSLSSFLRTTSRSGAALALVAAGVLILAGCSSSSDDTAASTTDPNASSEAGGQQMPARSGVSGLIASISDGVLQVQGADEQNAVSYDDATTVSETVSGDLDAIVVGSCVVVMGTSDGADAEGDDATGAVTAESVTVSDAVDGECTGGFGGGGAPSGGMPEGGEMPSGAPADGEMPSVAPSGAADGGGMGGGFAVGLVTAVDGDAVTVESSFGEETTTSSVLTTADTTVTTTVSSDSSALEVGRCVTVQGEADDAGTVAATALTVTDTVDGECTTGFGGGFGGLPGGASTDE